MTKRLSLRGQMTVSYLLVTAAAVLLAEVIIMAVVFPQALADADLSTQVRNTANVFVKQSAAWLAADRRLPTSGQELFGQPGLQPSGKPVPPDPGRERPIDRFAEDGEATVPIPLLTGGALPADRPVGFVLLLNPDGTVRASSYPGRYPVGKRGSDLPAPATSGLTGMQEGTLDTPAGPVRWASMPIIELPGGVPVIGREPELTAKGDAGLRVEAVPLPEGKGEIVRRGKLNKGSVVGAVYVQVPATMARPSLLGAIGPTLRRAGPALAAGLGLLLVTLPIGVVFGLLATRRLTARMQRLASTTARVAEGDLSLRLPVEGSDEVSQLERGFNRMAERLGVGIGVERQLAGANARMAERARIARELHDAISQGLFSLGMLTGGLRRALPAGSPLAEQVTAMESTVHRMSQEMRALLLELRPAALEEAGLVPALEELCRAYQSRLGLTVEAELEEVDLPAPAEHAVLRLVQEALANAVRHADPTTVWVRLAAEAEGTPEGGAVVTVTDDGCGFDPASAARRGMGLASMRGRIEELGGTFELLTGPERGTVVRAVLPTRSPQAMGQDWAALTWPT